MDIQNVEHALITLPQNVGIQIPTYTASYPIATGFSKLPIVYRFRVNAGGTTTEGIFTLRVFPAWYWEPLIVANNRTLHVEESTSVTITPSNLKVSIY